MDNFLSNVCVCVLARECLYMDLMNEKLKYSNSQVITTREYFVIDQHLFVWHFHYTANPFAQCRRGSCEAAATDHRQQSNARTKLILVAELQPANTHQHPKTI